MSNARTEFETTQARQRRAREARCGIGQEYHPFDLKTGAPRDAAEIVQVWLNHLVAGYYLALVAGRCGDSEERERLRDLSSSIVDQAKARDGPLSALNEQDVSYLEKQARLASELFQRSSSCVEGRNGQFYFVIMVCEKSRRESFECWVSSTTT